MAGDAPYSCGPRCGCLVAESLCPTKDLYHGLTINRIYGLMNTMFRLNIGDFAVGFADEMSGHEMHFAVEMEMLRELGDHADREASQKLRNRMHTLYGPK